MSVKDTVVWHKFPLHREHEQRHLEHAIRASLENFGRFEYDDPEAKNEIRHVDVIPLYDYK